MKDSLSAILSGKKPPPEELSDLQEFCSTHHPAEVADLLKDLLASEVWKILSCLDPELQARVFTHLDEGVQVDTAELLRRQELAQLITLMEPDDRVHLLKRFPEGKLETLLPALAQAEREDIRKLSSYPDGTAGSIMTSEYVTLPPDISAEQALARIRSEAPDKETIYYAYVIDEARRLEGFVSLKDLILARPVSRVEDIMSREVILSRTLDDQEEAASKIAKYDLLALPVVNESDVLVGIITYDDAMDIINQEYTEDMEKFMAIAGKHEERAYLRTSVWTHFKNRSLWVVILAALGLVSGMVIQKFEDTLMSLLILAAFIPMLADTGGNTGSQAATMVIRALALREISVKDALRVLWKEFRISILISIVLALLTFARVMFFSRHFEIPGQYSSIRVGISIATALGLQVISATLIGAVLPLIATRVKVDPAVVASPALTTVVDITGLLIFFTTVKLMLGI